ncbi:MAG: hypothetical protein ABIH71_00545, partial [Candidatus Omnitrophota bacterium]
ANDEKIHDIKADITVTSTADFLPPETHLKIWQKGDKQKVEEIYPEQEICVRPVLPDVEQATFMERSIVSYDSQNNIYIIKSKVISQTEEYPYEIDYIDYTKGVVVKTEYYLEEANFEMVQVKEFLGFIQIDDVWGFQKEVETVFGNGELYYTTTNIYSNIEINTGILDSEFQ